MDWEQRVSELWASFDEMSEDDFLAEMKRLSDERPDDAVAAFELAGAYDSTGDSDRAVPLYRKALANGLDGSRRRQAVIQLASSLRNMGEVRESVELLEAEKGNGSDGLDDAVSTFLALALADSGREREAVSVVLTALAPHLPRYRRSVANYARLLIAE